VRWRAGRFRPPTISRPGGDALSPDGTYMPVQPMIEPLHGGLSEVQVLSVLAGRKFSAGPDLVRETFVARTGGGMDEEKWSAFLRDGFLRESAPKPVPTAFNSGAARAALGMFPALTSPAGDAFEVVLVGDSKVDDGRYANNGWAQELPDPISRLTWDNAALVSPATAQKLGVELDTSASGRTDTARMIRITAGGASLELPLLVSPGHADRSVTVALGYGRRTIGRVGSAVGFDAYPLRSAAAPFVVAGAGVELLPAERTHKVAVTHGHWNMEGRDLFREGTLAEFKENPAFAKTMGMDSHIPPNFSLYRNPPLDRAEQWGMAIDLTVCTGCSACVVACQAENNIPIVGKEQVINQREMHWIRIDRYFASADPSVPDPEMVMQPVACMHCENAPCETVCPVNATVHSDDGLNVMVYNRCIGTRYCANNCPYKVRRFNYHRARLFLADRLPDLDRRRRLGFEPPGRLGVGHHELRVLDRHRPRRDADLGDPVPHPPEVAHLDQPRGRGDDDLRGHLRRHLSRHPRRPHLDGVVPGSRCRIPTPSGRTSAARCSGTCSPCRPISRFPCCSGMSA
jgi:Fe-S-cluster-containing dehydrogenase component